MDADGKRPGCASWLVLGAGAGAALILWTQKHDRQPAAPAPEHVHTVIVHQVTTRVLQPGFPAWAVVIITVVALGVFCAITLGRRSG